MDIRARTILSKIRQIKGAEESIIAGGAPRDEILGFKPKDYDIYVPQAYYNIVYDFVIKEAKLSPAEIKKTKDSMTYASTSLSGVRTIPYEGIELQLMSFRNYKNEKSFREQVMDSFDYGICKIAYEDSGILTDTPEFQQDVQSNTMTLYKLDSFDELPRAMARFNYLNNKLGNRWYFNTPRLKFVEDEKKDSKEGYRSGSTEEYSRLYSNGSFVTEARVNTLAVNDFAERTVQMVQQDIGNVGGVVIRNDAIPVTVGGTLRTERPARPWANTARVGVPDGDPAPAPRDPIARPIGFENDEVF